MCDLMTDRAVVLISNSRPVFGWIVPEALPGGRQCAWQLQVASSAEGLVGNKADIWDSGQVTSDVSVDVRYAGAPLAAGKDHFWRVRVWGQDGEATAYSDVQCFRTAHVMDASEIGDLLDLAGRYPLIQTPLKPQRLVELGPGHWFVDFGKVAFGYLMINGLDDHVGSSLEFRFGEKAIGEGAGTEDAVDMEPGGSIRAGVSTLRVEAGTGWRQPVMPSFKMPGTFVALPESLPAIMPFRFVEIANCPIPLAPEDLMQMMVLYPFDDEAASFACSDDMLNAVWDLCKYSIKATTYMGVYVDGDRERKAYEGDAYINQLGHYYTDREFTLARFSHEYLLVNPTWPTEWHHHPAFMAWMDYLYTANTDSLTRCYDLLEGKLLQDRWRPDGLLGSAPDEHGRPDLVDWPPVERDGYVFTELNTVVNAFHYRALVLMAKCAEVLGRHDDAHAYSERAERVRGLFEGTFFDAGRGVYRDGVGTDSTSLHANLFPLAFGLVAPEHKAGVVDFIKSRGMACSVYAAHYLLEALFESGEDAAALNLITDSSTDRSWDHMVTSGTTITWEAWDLRYKPNQDWNHAWGAAPANILPRYVLGVRPLEPGFARALIQPQPGSLTWIKGKVPTIRGPIEVDMQRSQSGVTLAVKLPANMEGRGGVGPGLRGARSRGFGGYGERDTHQRCH